MYSAVIKTVVQKHVSMIVLAILLRFMVIGIYPLAPLRLKCL